MLYDGGKSIEYIWIDGKTVETMWIGPDKVWEGDNGTWGALDAWESDKIWIKEHLRKKYGTVK